MSGTKSTAPETLEELRAALRRWVDGTRSYADHVERDAGAYQDAVWRIAIHRDAANQIAALLPEPIKVGDRVRHIPSGDMEATVTDLGTERAIFVQLDDGQDDVWLTKHTERVAPAPSDTEQPEHVCSIFVSGACPDCGAHTATPAPAPSPEVPEGWPSGSTPGGAS